MIFGKKIFTLTILAVLLIFVQDQNLDAVKGLLFKEKRPSNSFSRSLAHYTVAIIYDNEGRYEEAIEEYTKAINLEPKVSFLHARLGADYLLTKKEDRAIEELKKAKSLDTQDTRPRLLLGLIYTSLNRYKDAQKEYEEVIRIDPDSIWGLSSLADLYILQEKTTEASAIYEKLLKKEVEDETDSSILFFNLGVIYAKMAKYDAAIEKFLESVKLNPNYLEAYIALGVLYEVKKDLPAAIASYEKALKVDPLNTAVYHHLAGVYCEANRIDDAVSQYELLIKLNPNDIAAYIEWASIYIRRNDPAQAVSVLQKGIHADIKDATFYTALGYAYSLAETDSASALKFYNMALELKPDEPVAHFYRGVLYDRINEKELAIKEFRETIRLKPEFAEAYNYLGYTFAEDGVSLDEAIQLIKKALDLDPDNAAYMDSLGWAYFKKGMYGEALFELKRAADAGPNDPTIREHLKKVKEKLNQ